LKTIENSEIKNFLLILPGCYRALAFSVIAAMMNVSNDTGGTKFNAIQTNYLIFLILASLFYFVLIRHEKPLMVLLLVEYFTVFFYAYIEPHFLFMEIIWIPGIIMVLAFILSGWPGTFLIPALGIAGTAFFSYGFIYDVPITIGALSLPYIVLVFFLYTPITLSSIVLSCACFRIESMEKKYFNLQIEYKKLDEINNAISQRIFGLQNDATQEERNRLSKEIHDTAGYVFINLIMMLQAASAVLYRDIRKTGELISNARDYAEMGINEIRYLLRNIRDYPPARLSLQNEFFSIGDSFQKATNVEIDIEYGPWPKTFQKNLDSFFISFMQESLTNALKHGHATHISVLCWDNKAYIGMTITDNGSGAELPIKKGIGITAMEDAVNQFGGSIHIRSGKNGFKLTATVPKLSLFNTLPGY
jgi:signal transduction histidine kinase